MEAAEEPEQPAPLSARPGEEQISTSEPSVAQALEANPDASNGIQPLTPAVTRPLYETSQTQVQAVPSPYATPFVQQARAGQIYEQFGSPGEVLPSNADMPFIGQAPAENAPVSYQQAAYGIFPGQPYTPPPTSRQRRYALWIAAIVVVLLLLGGGATLTFALAARPPLPDATIQTYCHGVKTGNAQEIYNVLSQQARTKTSIADIQQMFGALQGLSGLGISYTDCTFSDVRVSGSLAVATVTLTMTMDAAGTNISLPNASLISLVLESNQWKVDFSNLTQPLPGLLSSSV